MNRFINVIFLFACAYSTLAIAQTEVPKDSTAQVTEQSPAAPEFTTINVCRPGALTKMFSNLDFYLNGKSVGEIKNKTTSSFKLRLGDKFKIGQESSILMARLYDDFALIGTATEPSEIHIVLRVKSNLSDALVQTFGGALVLGAAKSFESGNSKNWDAEVVDKEKYAAACTFK
jgi:hypothetical protein